MRWYRLPAKAFPRAFRHEYEQDLESAAQDLMNAEGDQGPLHRARLSMGLAVDDLIW